MATGSREDPEAAGIAPAAQRSRRDAQHAAGFRKGYPIAISELTAGQNLLKSSQRFATRLLYHSAAPVEKGKRRRQGADAVRGDRVQHELDVADSLRRKGA